MKNKAAAFLAALIISSCLTSCSAKAPDESISRPEGLDVFLEGQEISALFDDGERLWVGGRDGILLLDDESGETLCRLEADIEMIYASDICQTADGTVWAGHSGGLTAFSPQGQKLFSLSAPEIPAGRINTLTPDKGGLWLGAMEGAAYLAAENGGWRVKETLTSQNGLSDDCVNAILRFDDRLIFGAYLASGRGGLAIRDDAGRWQYLSVDDGLPHRYINAVWPLSKSRLLIGTGHLNIGGLALAQKSEDGFKITKTWGIADGIPGDKVRWLFCDSVGRLYITTESNGMLLCPSAASLDASPIDGITLTRETGLSDNEIKTIAESESCLWFGSRSGLIRVEKSRIDDQLIN